MSRAIIWAAVGLWVGLAIVWSRVDDCGRASTVNSMCLVWVDDGGFHLAPIPK